MEAEMSQKLSWRDWFVQIELWVDIASLGNKYQENHRVQIFGTF